MRKNNTKKHIVVCFSICFILQQIVWADPYVKADHYDTVTLAQETLFNPASKDAFERVFSAWLAKGGIDLLKSFPIARAEKIFNDVDPGAFNKAKETITRRNGAQYGQFILREGKRIVRCYNPLVKTYFPNKECGVLWDIRINERARIQLLEIKETGSSGEEDRTVIDTIREILAGEKDISAQGLTDRSGLFRETVLNEVEFLAKKEYNPAARKIMIEVSCAILKDTEPYYKMVIGVLANLRDARFITRYYLTGSFARGWMRGAPSDIDIVVSLRSVRGQPEQSNMRKIEAVLEYVNKNSPLKFRINYLPYGEVFKIDGDDVKDTFDLVNEKMIPPGDKKHRLINITDIKPSSGFNGENFLSGVYRKISQEQSVPAFRGGTPKAKISAEAVEKNIDHLIVDLLKQLKARGVETALAGVDLAELEEDRQIMDYLYCYCIVRDKYRLKDLLEKRLKDEEVELFDAVFNPRSMVHKRVVEAGEDPIKVVQIRGGRGAAGITRELSLLARENIIDLKIIPGAVDDGRSFANIAYYFKATGVPDMGKSYSNLGTDKYAIDFIEQRIIKNGSINPATGEEYTIEEALDVFDAFIITISLPQDSEPENDQVKRLFRSYKALDDSKTGQMRRYLMNFQKIIEAERTIKDHKIDISQVPMRTAIIIGAKHELNSWQKAIDALGKLLGSAGKVILPTEERLHAMAILRDGTLLSTENAINEARKKSDYLFFTVGPESFVGRTILTMFFKAKNRAPTPEEEEILTKLRKGEHDEMADADRINILEGMDKAQVEDFLKFVREKLSYINASPKIAIQQAAIQALEDADLIVYGPTDIESNIASAIIYEETSDAIKENKKAVKVLIANSRDEHDAEPPGVTTSSQIRRLHGYLTDQTGNGDRFPVEDHIQYVLGRNSDHNPEVTDYIPFDKRVISKMGVIPIGLNLEMLNMTDVSNSGDFWAKYEKNKSGKYNDSLVADIILSLVGIKKTERTLEEVDDSYLKISEKGMYSDVPPRLKEDTIPVLKNNMDTAGERIKTEEKKKIGIFIDDKLGEGRIDAIKEALVDISRSNDPLTKKWLSNIVIHSDGVTDQNLESFGKDRKIKKEDMIIMTRDIDFSWLKEKYEGISVITKIDDNDLLPDAYYPFLEIVNFAVARLGVLDFTKADIVEFYNDIPNIEKLSAENIVALCWDDMTNTCKSTILLKVGVPNAEQVTASPDLDRKISEYFRTSA